MKPIAFCLLILVELFSCTSQTDYDEQPNPEAIVKDFNTWWNYNSVKINFAREYLTFDKDSKPISKESFFQSLMSGDFIALKLLSKDTSRQHYKLYRLSSSVPGNIAEQTAAFGEREYQKFKMEGMPLPDFNFTDLNGKVYNKETIKDKIIVMNIWFIQCVPCVAEMPALNNIVSAYQNRKDILFLGLSLDTENMIKDFLKKRDFSYSLIAEQGNYIKDKLHIRSYPTQIIVNKEGKIIRVFNDYKDIVYWLNKEAQLSNPL